MTQYNGSPPDEDDYFNSPIQPSSVDDRNGDGTNVGQASSPANGAIPKQKRIACILCRKRKLKCDSNKPSCGTCRRLGHDCEYSEERKKSGPKRGYVKLLEQRLKQVEDLLQTQQPENTVPTTTSNPPDNFTMPQAQMPQMPQIPAEALDSLAPDPMVLDPMLDNPMPAFNFEADDFSWEMIGLGLEEALPSQDAIDELNQIYFDKMHPSLPMIHKGRYLMSMDLAPHMRPPVCLRYAMWMHSCSITAKYSAYTEHFYARARKYAEQDEMRGHGESIISLAHCQCWTLLACYEFKLMYFPRAWMSIGRASRLAQMMGLHRQDRVGLDVKQTLPPPRDWTDREERRRTFWMAFCQDRYASIGTGWPMTFEEADILTNLPASENAFITGQEEPTLQLSEVLKGEGTESISSFAGVILLATLYGRNLTHLHRPNDNDMDHNLNGEFWKRHRNLDNILLNISLQMPEALRLPGAIGDPNAVFCNMNVHTATICLHQAAIFKADKHKLPGQISAESKRRCIVAADQVTNIMRVISHIDLSTMNPFLAFNLYVAARVFVQYLKSRKEDTAVKSSLHFLLSAMQVLKTKNPLTESFLVQLDVDLEGSGLDIPTSSRYRFQKRGATGDMQQDPDAINCSPLYEIRESAGQANQPVPTPRQQYEDHNGPHWRGDGGVIPYDTTLDDAPSMFNDIFGRTPSRAGKYPDDGSKKPGIGDHLKPAAFGSGDFIYTPPSSGSPGSGPGTGPSQSGHGHAGVHSHELSPPDQPVPFAPNMTNSSTGSSYGAGVEGSLNIGSTSSNSAFGYSFAAGRSNANASVRRQPGQSEGQVTGLQQEVPTPFSTTGMTPGATGMTPLPDSVWGRSPRNEEWMPNTWYAETPKERAR